MPSLQALIMRIKVITQPVTQEHDAKYCDRQRNAWPCGYPPMTREIIPSDAEHESPRNIRWVDTKPKKAQTGLCNDAGSNC